MMNNDAQVIEKISQTAIFQYLSRLVTSDFKKLTLFAVFPYTGAANRSAAVHFAVLSDTRVLVNMYARRVCLN